MRSLQALAIKLLMPCTLGWIESSCGGAAVVNEELSGRDAGADAALHADVVAGTGGAAGDGAAGAAGASGAQDAAPEAEATCSMPVGEAAFGCPLILAPACDDARVGLGGGSCEFPIESSVPIPEEDLPYLNVFLGEWDKPDGMLLRVANEAGCATTGNGWYLDDPKHPTTIHVCPNACQCIVDAKQVIQAGLGCWGHAAPGVLDTEIPCARCASSRPEKCGQQQFSTMSLNFRCKFTLEPPEWSAETDPMLINVGYGSTLPSSYTGYLQWVPSLDHCDEVEEGWTMDTSAQPMVIEVCPSACSCAKVNGARFHLEYGCPRYQGPGTP